MSKSRRQFLTRASIGFLVTSAGCRKPAEQSSELPPGAPPAFGTAPDVGPPVSTATFAEAEKLVQFPLTAPERETAAGNWRKSMAPVYERRTGPRKLAIEPSVAPATQWNPAIPGVRIGPERDRFVRSKIDPGPSARERRRYRVRAGYAALALDRDAGAHLPASHRNLSRSPAALRSQAPLRDHAHSRCGVGAIQQADAEIAAGHYRGPLHGIPFGVKDLLDTAGIPTTYGAEPFRNRVPEADSAVVKRLREAGAVLVAKLSLGALALNDIWFGGQTMNPWLLEEGASGSSAGPGAATAAGLVGFSIGSETGGSIVSPSMRCGITGLRPTYGRVPRTGAMTLCWSLDKLGPMTRGVEDGMLALQAIAGPDAAISPAFPPSRFRRRRARAGLARRVLPELDEGSARDRCRPRRARRCKETRHGPDRSTSSGLAVRLSRSDPLRRSRRGIRRSYAQRRIAPAQGASPRRMAQPLSAGALSLRRRFRTSRPHAAQSRAGDGAYLRRGRLTPGSSLRDEMLTISNFTGHPSLTLRAGFVEVSEARSDWAPDPAHPLPKFSPPRRVPHGVTLIGRLFEEGTLGSVGIALERDLHVMAERPPGF